MSGVSGVERIQPLCFVCVMSWNKTKRETAVHTKSVFHSLVFIPSIFLFLFFLVVIFLLFFFSPFTLSFVPSDPPIQQTAIRADLAAASRTVLKRYCTGKRHEIAEAITATPPPPPPPAPPCKSPRPSGTFPLSPVVPIRWPLTANHC